MQESWKLPATKVVELLKRKKVSPLELIDAAEARIAATNPKINAFVTLCYDRARAHVRRLMKKKPSGKAPPHYLYGLPIGVKDGTDVEGVRCTSGRRIYAERIAPSSDIVVQAAAGRRQRRPRHRARGGPCARCWVRLRPASSGPFDPTSCRSPDPRGSLVARRRHIA